MPGVDPEIISSGRDWRPPPGVRAVAVVGFAMGLAVGAGGLHALQDERPVPIDGEVVVCEGVAFAFVRVAGMPAEPVEVHLPLRGDDLLLPIIVEGTRIIAGRPRAHQEFVPVRGRLALMVPIAAPETADVEAQVGDRRLSLRVRHCGDAE